MKSHIRNKDIVFPDSTLIKTTKETFAEYLIYINHPQIEFPNNISFEFFNGFQHSGEPYGAFYLPNEFNEHYTLRLEQVHTLNKNKESLYHEFTHIMDYIVLNSHLSFEEIKQLKFIAEVRAKYIECCTRMDFINAFENHKITYNSLIKSKFSKKPLSINEELSNYNELLFNKISLFNNVLSSLDYQDLLKFLYYYIGFITFIEKNSETEINTSQITELLKPIMGESVIDFFNIRKNIPLNFSNIDKNLLLETIQIIHNIIPNKFLTISILNIVKKNNVVYILIILKFYSLN